MIRFLAFLLAFMVAVHLAAPTAVAANTPIQEFAATAMMAGGSGSELPSESNDDALPLSPHATTKCHDQCAGFTVWLSPHAASAGLLSIHGREQDLSFTFIPIIVPPPQ
ncbi:hypothetical protein [Neoaquamicrobium sediminum]|jgi:hypothetical protein|uniref:hypothetical protein n=1 Tax=Neoaquamicrobium sediminum TaxID=1849104 RepID=UPI00156593B3|nr:hypothetical protein [Mesorhizobium sediminum]NRC52946.1 hypothetical protein [Mesorhizobium sediminum]